MDRLIIPFGNGTDTAHITDAYSAVHQGPVVEIDFPDDGRVFTFDKVISLYRWLGDWLMEHPKPADPLPTKMHATIRARVQGLAGARVLTLVDTDDLPWRSTDDGWYGPEHIESFEVLFPGVDS